MRKLFNNLTNWEANISFNKGLINTVDWFRNAYGNSSDVFIEETGRNWD